ncbi:MAG: ATP-dependent helicase HrpB [Candidatus Obscuribacterales bacterium]|nr:ATP-dependent helicase HrpB [Candidatus Obscuribacterales bacterium]
MPASITPLPIDEVLPRVLQHLSEQGVLVLSAQPGAGKTTRVPPAILDAGLADLPGKNSGLIIVLQPRRVAARAAAARISDERKTELGAETGYQVRFEKQSSSHTRILVCTEGIFLRKLQDDPFLEDTAAVIFDEFHERSIDSDLALAMVRQVRNEVRPDLKLVVMSATLDTNPVSQYLGNCPIVESPGRTYPIEIEYLQFPSNEAPEKLAADGVNRLLKRTSGHTLVFLPGVGEIRQTEALLESTATAEHLAIMPLYGDLPLEEQHRVLRSTEQRKIVLATNVAETSLTIDGVTAVVDTGLARINRLDPQLGLNRLELARISRASADQRAGRAGRTEAGICLRLWSEREHFMLRDFELPEIARVDLSQCLLQLLAWGEQDVRVFPWYDSPPPAVLDQALLLLERLGALENGKLTDTGKEMARLPLQPRLARLLLEGGRRGQAGRAAICAALLSERAPFQRREAPVQASHHSDSDVLDRISAIEDFARNGIRDSSAGKLLSGPAKQILRASDQLLRLMRTPKSKHSESASTAHGDEAILRAIMVAFPDRICKRREAKGRRAIMVGGRGVRLADESAVGTAELFVAVEVTDSGQAESLVRQASSIERDWLPSALLTSNVEIAFDSAKAKVTATKRTRLCDIVLDERPVAVPPETDTSAILAQAILARFDLASLIPEEATQYLARIQCLREWLPQLDLPDFGNSPWAELLPEWCLGCTSVDDLNAPALISVIQTRLSPDQLSAIEREAPEKVTVPSGSKIKVDYEQGKPPVVAVRIQELFGMRETPRLANSRIPVLLHLLAPNYRIQQITPDLASFWKNTYADVKKDLKRRYPKHSWPDDPLNAQPEHRPQRKRVD